MIPRIAQPEDDAVAGSCATGFPACHSSDWKVGRTGWVAVAALAFTCTCLAGSTQSSIDFQQEGITANKSVAIDSSEPIAAAQTAANGTGEIQNAAETIVVPRRASGGETSVAGSTTPWYRTGIGALAVVMVVVGVAYWLVRRWMPGVRSAESGVLRVVGRTPLTPKHSATLIQLGRRFLLVGVSPDRVEVLCEVADADEVAELTARMGPHGFGGTKAFDQLLAGEAAEYHTEAGGVADRLRPATPARQPTRTPGPLTDLLKRLRVLQSQ